MPQPPDGKLELWVHRGSPGRALRRLRVSRPVFLAFLAACPLGAAGVSWLGTTWVWAIPLVASPTAFPLARQLEP
jgi:hypothetical protein